jgi:hypothetical protein
MMNSVTVRRFRRDRGESTTMTLNHNDRMRSLLIALTASAGLAMSALAQCPHHAAEAEAAAEADCSAITLGDRTMHRSEWRASTFSISSQAEGALAVLPSGEMVAVWSSRRQQEGHYGVYMQRFDARGVAIGEETGLGLWGRSHQSSPVIAAGPKGETWAAWVSHHQDGELGSIIARRMDGDASSEILVNATQRGHQGSPVIAATPDGGAVLIWQSVPTPHTPPQLMGRIIAADGTFVTDEFAISSSSDRHERCPSIAMHTDGSFAVAYGVFEGSTPDGIRLQRFNSDGERLGDEHIVAGELGEAQIEPVIAATTTGYLVAWLDNGAEGDDYAVMAQRLAKDGELVGRPFMAHAETDGAQIAPAIAVQPDGSFVIAYNSADTDGDGIHAQAFDADGSRLGTAIRLTEHEAGRQSMRRGLGTNRLVATPSGGLAAVWSGDAGTDDGSSVNITMLSPNPIDRGDLALGVTDAMKPATAVATSETAQPHIPPTFDPQTIGRDQREVSITADGVGFTGIVSTGWTPPDPQMAVGPDHIVAMTNGAIAFFEKDGTKVFEDEIEDSFGFWGSVGATGFVFDPEALYDPISGRYFAMAAEAYAPGGRSYVLVAVSDDSDPNGEWHKYRFETTDLSGNLFDSPNMAVDEDVLYITGDGFGFGANYPVYTFDKASLLVGDPPAVAQQTTLSTSTQSAGIPPVSFDDPPALYMIEHQEGSNRTGVRLIALTDPLGAMDFHTFTLTVPAYSNPADPPQLGTSVRPESFDARFWSVAYRDGSLWATHHVNSSRVRVRWYQIAMNGFPFTDFDPQLIQSGEIDEGNLSTFFSSITVNESGDAALAFSRSSSSEYISMATAYRTANDPFGTMRPMVVQKQSTGPSTSGRWGDYSAVEVDPADGRTFWAHHEYFETFWKTWINSFAPPTPDGDLDGDGDVDLADLGILLASYGVDDGGDLDGDGDTDLADLGILLANYGFGT